MLSNAYFLAKFRFDTAEKEPAKNLLILPILLTLTLTLLPGPGGRGRGFARPSATQSIASGFHTHGYASRSGLSRGRDRR